MRTEHKMTMEHNDHAKITMLQSRDTTVHARNSGTLSRRQMDTGMCDAIRHTGKCLLGYVRQPEGANTFVMPQKCCPSCGTKLSYITYAG